MWRSCPFWQEDGQCALRDCSVCECEPNEIPACWQEEDASDAAKQSQLSRVTFGAENGIAASGAQMPYSAGAAVKHADAAAGASSKSKGDSGSRQGEGEDEEEGASSGSGRYSEENVWTVQDTSSPDMQYVNLLRNPEGYTGYAGPAAQRVWQAIYRENCFTGPLEGMCLEERAFYRLLSGLQTSINTHVAMTYNEGKGSRADLYQETDSPSELQSPVQGSHGRGHGQGVGAAGVAQPALAAARAYVAQAVAAAKSALGLTSPTTASDKEAYAPGTVVGGSGPMPVAQLVLTPGLAPSVQMYIERIGKWPERIKNLYFAFLFVVRAVAKAGPLLTSMNYTTGNATDDAATRALVHRLLDVEIPAVVRGFDESVMFRVTKDELVGSCPPVLHGLDELHELQHRYLAAAAAKEVLLEQFRGRFRNISRIMDCVGCEKCRLWGKLQFLGVGTALKILFADADITGSGGSGGSGSSSASSVPLNLHLSRNEVVALINVLHRMSMSLSAIQVMRDLEAEAKIRAFGAYAGVALVAVLVALWMLVRVCRGRGSGKGGGSSQSKTGTQTDKSAQTQANGGTGSSVTYNRPIEGAETSKTKKNI